MSINLQEVAEFLLTNGYMSLEDKGKYKLTTKFHSDLKEARRAPTGELTVGDSTELIRSDKFYFSWENRYKQFILDAKVPKRLDARHGESYQANAYSEEGMKAFRKAIEAGTDLQMLIRATQLYYASTIHYKQAITAFMAKGTWKTHYDELVSAAGIGEQALVDHIKNETENGQQSSYQLG